MRCELTEEFVAKAARYLDIYEDELGDTTPSIVGLARYMGVRKNRLYLYKTEQKGPVELCRKMAEIMGQIVDEQERKLINNGLTGNYNQTITKLMLSKHGYSDAQRVDHSSTDGSMTPPPTRIELVPMNESDNG